MPDVSLSSNWKGWKLLTAWLKKKENKNKLLECLDPNHTNEKQQTDYIPKLVPACIIGICSLVIFSFSLSEKKMSKYQILEMKWKSYLIA